MKREIINTGDGSNTIHLPEWNEQYHSIHGAIQEARHVFIEMGLKKALATNSHEINILEVGFGTGLNALVTWQEVLNRSINLYYTGVEAYPVQPDEVKKLNFSEEIKENKVKEVFTLMHELPWELSQEVTPRFFLHKQKKFFQEITETGKYDLIYFDAFGARVQPELWTASIFKTMHQALKPNGFLVTYAAKGSVRRAMIEVGFTVERLPGPPGKREMLRATKITP